MPQISIAPMMGCTDRHFRYFLRYITSQALLYTEMITTGAILNGDRQLFLAFDSREHPLALQLGGSDPLALAECAKIAEDYGYDEVNLNVGCPSDRVQSGKFGACLMAEPELVAGCVAKMVEAVKIPITVKTRIGIDNEDSYEKLCEFIQIVSSAGCPVFIIHARKAWLKGLSPKENRTIPPLRYDVVKQIKADFPHLKIILNGGIVDASQVNQYLLEFDGIMIGRAIYQNPFLLTAIETGIPASFSDRINTLEKLIPYIQQQINIGIPLSRIARHLFGAFHTMKGANIWRRYLNEYALRNDTNIEVMHNAIKMMTIALTKTNEEMDEYYTSRGIIINKI